MTFCTPQVADTVQMLSPKPAKADAETGPLEAGEAVAAPIA